MRIAIVLVYAALASACANSIAQAERPAVIVNPTAASRAELLSTLQKALNNRPLTLADDALTQDSVLIIEPVRLRDAEGRLLNGRELGMPERFQLVMQESKCILIHERTQQRWVLKRTKCRGK